MLNTIRQLATVTRKKLGMGLAQTRPIPRQ